MKTNHIELPISAPIYSTYHYQCVGSAVIGSNPSIRNWYLNKVMILVCERDFLTGCPSPSINVSDSMWHSNPYLLRLSYPMEFIEEYIYKLICELLYAGYYVYYDGGDDFYIPGKTWYNERHFIHDGMIVGLDEGDKTFCLYAYDKNWTLSRFWVPQNSILTAMKKAWEKDVFGFVYGIKPKDEIAEFSPNIAMDKIQEYLDSDMEKYPESSSGRVYGIVVHEYLAKYIDCLHNGSLPYEKMDYRAMRIIWEHKSLMCERVGLLEKTFNLDMSIQARYLDVVKEADSIRLMYASHHLKRRDKLLPIIREKLLRIEKTEKELLAELVNKTTRRN